MGRNSRRRSSRDLRRHPVSGITTPAFDPKTEYRLSYKLDFPGGLLRSEYPATVAGTLLADTEAELARNVLVTLSQAFGFLREFSASVAFLCETLGPLSVAMRKEIALGLMTGRGMQIRMSSGLFCPSCGAGQEVRKEYTEDVTMLEDATGDWEPTSIDHDVTTHDDKCPYFHINDRPDPFPWREEPTIVIEQPYKYTPVPTPSEPEQGQDK